MRPFPCILVMLCGTVSVHGADGAKRDPDGTTASLRVEKTANGFDLRIVLPERAQADDSIVVVHVTDKSVKSPAEIIRSPNGKISDAIRDVKSIADKTGIEVHSEMTFSNGSFELVVAKNTQGKSGVYAITQVLSKRNKKILGASATYFHVGDWAVDKEGTIEIPRPDAPSGPGEKYIPKSGELFLWVVTKDGRKTAEGKIKIVEK